MGIVFGAAIVAVSAWLISVRIRFADTHMDSSRIKNLASIFME